MKHSITRPAFHHLGRHPIACPYIGRNWYNRDVTRTSVARLRTAALCTIRAIQSQPGLQISPRSDISKRSQCDPRVRVERQRGQACRDETDTQEQGYFADAIVTEDTQ